MKITFRGLRRAVILHERETDLKWNSGTEASGTLKDLGLNGDFSIRLKFGIGELEKWIMKYLQNDPAGALRLASKIQAEAICALTKKSDVVADTKERPKSRRPLLKDHKVAASAS